MRTNFERSRRSGRESNINSNSNSSSNKDANHPARKCFINIFEVLDDDKRRRFVERARARVERLTGRPASTDRLEHYGKSYVLKSGCDESEFVSILEYLDRDAMRAMMEKNSQRRERIGKMKAGEYTSAGRQHVQEKKCARKQFTPVGYSGRQTSGRAVFDVTRQNQGEKRLRSVTDDRYDHVTDESLAVLAKIECRLLDYLEHAPLVPVKKSQAQVDLEIVKHFYENPTPEAFAGLWKRYRWGVQSHISKFVGDWSNSDDLVQDTFQKAWEKRFLFDPLKASFSTWLYTIARNLTFTQLKKDGQTKIIDVDVNDVYTSALYPNGENAATVDEAYYIVNSPDNVENNTFDDVTHKMYTESVSRVKDMDPLFQKVLIMKNLRGMTLHQISEALSISESKLKNMYYKCRDMLCGRIKEECSELYNIYIDAAHDHAEEDSQYMYG